MAKNFASERWKPLPGQQVPTDSSTPPRLKDITRPERNWGKWELKAYQWKGSFPGLVRWARRAGTREFCLALAAPVGPIQNIFFLVVSLLYFTSFVHIAQQTGQAMAVVPRRLSLNMCLWTWLTYPVAEFIDLWLGDKVNSGIRLSYRPTNHVAWCAGKTTFCRSWLYPPSQRYMNSTTA